MRDLTALERIKLRCGAGIAARRLQLLRRLDRTRLKSAAAVQRLHELLCFLRAYPDDAAVAAQVERMLARFAQRADLRVHRDELAATGIAGTTQWFPYFWPTARWAVERWPALLQFDRSDKEAADNLLKALPLLASPLEAAAIKERRLDGFAAIDRLRGKQTDAAFVVRRVAALPASEPLREAIYDAINPSCHLQPGRSVPGRSAATMTPSRTLDRLPVKPAYRTAPFTAGRADLRAELERAPRAFRCLSLRDGARVIDLARRALAVRERDLDAFAWGNERDVWWVDDFDGRAYALIGMQPARRAPVAAIYGTLYLQNGVPVGYGQSDHVGRACALSFNLFDTFRGSEASHVLARVMAALHAVFGAASFSVEPYQLGQDNDEGIASGAWWFWLKHGFAPREAEALKAARAEQQRSARNPAHRSSEDTLRQLARWHLYFELDPAQPTPLPPLADLGLRAAATLASIDDDRDAALARCLKQAQRACGLRSERALSPAEREAWRQWAPLLALLPGLPRWPRADRQAICNLITAKAAPSEREYVLRLAAHARLRHALLAEPG
ncbi:MAG: hypothetical protein U5L03_08230 [Burkholderiaceae bacterium]|nr:hypothetical protein [Burkholderiaceae bacterium]